MRKGALVLIPFPFTDLSGHKVRPALILHVSRGEDCIAAFISSESSHKKHPCAVPVVPTNENGLKVKSVIKIDKIATLQKKIVLGELGKLESLVLKTVDRTIRSVFDV
jgi:mRNA interferase MazF